MSASTNLLGFGFVLVIREWLGVGSKQSTFAGITCPRPEYVAGGGFEMFAQTLNSTEASMLDQGKPLSDAPSQAYSATTLSHCISPRPSGATDCTAASDLCNTTPGPRETRAPRPALIYARSFRKKRMLRSSFARRVPATSIVRNFFRASLERSTNSACLLFSSGFDVQLRFVFERLLFLAPGRTEHSLVRQPLLRLLAVADRKYGIETWLENVRPRIV